MSRKDRFYALVVAVLAIATLLNVSAARRDGFSLFDPLVDVTHLIHKYYVDQTDDEQLAVGAINGMLHELDPYSEYIPAESLDEFQKLTSGSYEGIGTAIDMEEGYITIISPFEDSPAYKAGVLPGDKILEVNGRSTKGWTATQAVQELTGPAGTSVVLKVLHQNGTQETITIERGKIHVPSIRGWRRAGQNGGWDYLLDASAQIGYIRITQFTGDTATEMDKIITQLREDGMKGMLLDLRANPGGIMSTAIAIADRFLDEGVIVSTQGDKFETQISRATYPGTYPHFPLVVLVDQGSASASEIVAGALQDHGRAVIVGKRSWGKGSVQQIFHLPESGAAVKLTTNYYYLPNGRCVHRKPDAETWGVDPDVEEDLVNKHLDDVETNRQLKALRDLMRKLITPPAPATQDDTNDATAPGGPKDAAAAPAETDKEAAVDEPLLTDDDASPAAELLALDQQLAQAVKQAKGLLRAQPSLQGLADTLTPEPVEQRSQPVPVDIEE